VNNPEVKALEVGAARPHLQHRLILSHDSHETVRPPTTPAPKPTTKP